MNNRISYEIVEVKVWDLTNQLYDANSEEQLEILDKIDAWLAACGWTDIEFTTETLMRLDKNWFNNNLN